MPFPPVFLDLIIFVTNSEIMMGWLCTVAYMRATKHTDIGKSLTKPPLKRMAEIIRKY
jgi:hypothetical protein